MDLTGTGEKNFKGTVLAGVYVTRVSRESESERQKGRKWEKLTKFHSYDA